MCTFAANKERRQLPTFESFKYKLKQHYFKNAKPPSYYNVGNRYLNILQTRIRNNCSALHNDLFHANLIHNPSCSCGYSTENVEHFHNLFVDGKNDCWDIDNFIVIWVWETIVSYLLNSTKNTMILGVNKIQITFPKIHIPLGLHQLDYEHRHEERQHLLLEFSTKENIMNSDIMPKYLIYFYLWFSLWKNIKLQDII
jgi:hypothetical protein